MAHRDLVVVLAGQAGQGIQSIEALFVAMAAKQGFHVYASKEYMSRVRGGMNSTLIRVSEEAVGAFTERIDILVALAPGAVGHLGPRVGPGTIVVGDSAEIGAEAGLDLPLRAIGEELGNPVYSGVAGVGFLCAALGIPREAASRATAERYAEKGEAAVAANLAALERGFAVAEANRGRLPTPPRKPAAPAAGRILLDGHAAIALGALSGGCNYVCAYPMSPGTGVLTALAEYSKDYDIIVEQVEDEIGVINMAIGAWYSGARALVTTSGGGFALMGEGISLAGMIETPVVVHLAQRPGPATGLPTRTEQGDLGLALHAGHGHFPRAILAPGDIPEAFRLAQLAFDLADRAQSPVIVLSDQNLVDGWQDVDAFDPRAFAWEPRTVRAEEGYLRYAPGPDGASPRGIPGSGPGLVRVDSDEHDEEGRITESEAVRIRMEDKRLAKAAILERLALPPTRIGPERPRATAICWGSTKAAVIEAVRLLGDPGIAVLHFSQVWPLPAGTHEALAAGGKLILVENSSEGAFGHILEAHADVRIGSTILKYSGLPFSAEELASAIAAEAKGA